MSDSPLNIRAAHEDDLPLILSLIQALAEYERLRHECVADVEALRRWIFGEERIAEVVIGEWEGDAVGFALFFRNFSTFLGRPGIYLEDLFVRPEHRGRGVGKALLLHLARIAVERGYGRVEWAVLDWNQSAIDFYNSLGAVPMDEWTVFRLTGEALQRAGG